MNVIRATGQHVTDAQSWRSAHGQPAPPPCVYSNTGFAVEGLAALWLYTSNSCVAVLENLVGNPDAPAVERSAALDAVIQAGIAEAKRMGFAYVTCIVDFDRVEARCKRLGFAVTRRNITNLTMEL